MVFIWKEVEMFKGPKLFVGGSEKGWGRNDFGGGGDLEGRKGGLPKGASLLGVKGYSPFCNDSNQTSSQEFHCEASF